MAKKGYINKPEYKLSTVEFDLPGNKHVKFELVHNIPLVNGPVNSLEAAVDNWAMRTDKYTKESLIDYINSKGIYLAMTRDRADAKGVNYEF